MRRIRGATIDRLPGFICYDRLGTLQTTALAIEDGRVSAFYTMRNPDKLVQVAGLIAMADLRALHLR